MVQGFVQEVRRQLSRSQKSWRKQTELENIKVTMTLLLGDSVESINCLY